MGMEVVFVIVAFPDIPERRRVIFISENEEQIDLEIRKYEAVSVNVEKGVLTKCS